MFSYGEGNIIDFSKMTGVYGLFAENASGKSSLLDAILYCCYDKCSRTSLAGKILNVDKDYFKCKFTFEKNGVTYVIERYGKKQKNGNIKVNVDFYYYDNNGEKVSLNGNDRRDTNKKIREYIGEYEEVILTSFSLQKDNIGFLDMTQRERSDLLTKFLGLEIFENLLDIAKTAYLKKKGKVENLKSMYVGVDLVELQEEIDLLQEREEEYTSKVTELDNKIKEIEQKIEQGQKLFIPIDKTLYSSEGQYERLLQEENQNKEELTQKIKRLTRELEEVKKQAEALNVTDEYKLQVEKNYEKFLENEKTELRLQTTRNSLHQQISKLTSEIDYYKQQQEYNPNCEYCVKRNKEQIEKLESLAEEKERIELELKETETLLIDIENWLSKQGSTYQEEYNCLYMQMSNFRKLITTISNLQSQVSNSKIELQRCENRIKTLKEDYDRFIKVKEHQQFNQKVEYQLDALRVGKKQLEEERSPLKAQLQEVAVDRKIKENRMQDILKVLDSLEKAQKELEIFDWYIEAVKYTGVPLFLIKQIIPRLEIEVNNILSSIVDFQLEFEVTDKNIDVYITYGDERRWPAEMTSGMERFISQLIIRQSLIKLSSLPKPGFTVIDEGWGVLSANSLGNIPPLFNLLRDFHQIVIVISHIDVMKDMVDNYLEIDKTSKFSKVVYV